MGKFHYRDGWYFERLEDGSVLITYPVKILDDEKIMKFRIDGDSWASIVAAVTPTGDNAETFDMAMRLHNRQL